MFLSSASLAKQAFPVLCGGFCVGNLSGGCVRVTKLGLFELDWLHIGVPFLGPSVPRNKVWMPFRLFPPSDLVVSSKEVGCCFLQDPKQQVLIEFGNTKSLVEEWGGSSLLLGDSDHLGRNSIL